MCKQRYLRRAGGIILALGLGLWGCLTPAQKPKPKEVTEGPKRPKPVEIYEEDTSATKVQPAPTPSPGDTTKTVPSRDTVFIVRPPEDTVKTSLPPSRQTLPGFRVQVFASTSRMNAEKVLGEARTALGEKTYLETVPPLFKVRAGNCLTQQEAQDLKELAIQKGYRAAFVVETDIEP
jgi:SPOR domain